MRCLFYPDCQCYDYLTNPTSPAEELIMLKNLLRIPDTFDPADRRRRQVLNVLMIIHVTLNSINIGLAVILFITTSGNYKTSFLQPILVEIFLIILLIINRSRRIPSWVVGSFLILFLIALFTQVDTPAELYRGRSTIIWIIPILIGTIIFPTGYQFMVLFVICLLIQFLTPPDPNYPEQVIYYFPMLELLFITLISWIGQRISEQAIRDARKQADGARRHAANLEAVLNSISDGVLVLDLNGQVLSTNPALLKMIPKEQLEKLIAKPLDTKLRWKNKFFSISKSPVPEIGSVAIFRDETRRVETERAKDALLATASHELRTPLTAIMNYLEMIQTFIKMDKISAVEFNEYIDRAIENLNRLRNLVNNILDQAQIQAGALELKEKLFNLPTLLEKNRQLLDTLLKQKALNYSLDIAPDVPFEIKGDPDRLHQVLVNLVGNAIKFTKQGGIHVKVFLMNQDNLAIEVADTGAGIPDERLPDIFEAFRRGSDYAQREQQGAGLGLSIAKEIVNRMGGEISVASTLGVGSTFTVSIPLQPT
jgi:signal transduction histidine kinase